MGLAIVFSRFHSVFLCAKFEIFTNDEKKRIARDVLCLMYLLNNKHIVAHFTAMKDEIGNDAINHIKKWISNINAQKGSHL